MEDALKRFTLRRMRNGFGEGVSIPSQLRWVRYVNQWTNKMEKKYVERPIEIVEIHVWGLRSGVKVCVEGFVDEGKRIKNFHTFVREEKINVDEHFNRAPDTDPPQRAQTENLVSPSRATPSSSKSDLSTAEKEAIQNVVLRPPEPVRLPTSDVNIDFERRNKSGYTGFAMVTSVAHVWFNAYFEGGYEGNESGLFVIEWEAMDGIKGSARKGIKAFDRMKVVWKYSETGRSQSVDEPKHGEPIKESQPVDWRGEGDPENEIEGKSAEGVNGGHAGGTALTLGQMSSEAANKLMGKDLGLRKSDAASANISRASSVKDEDMKLPEPERTNKRLEHASDSEDEGVKPHVPDQHDGTGRVINHESHDQDRQDTATGKYLEVGIAKVSTIIAKMKGSDPARETKDTSKQ